MREFLENLTATILAGVYILLAMSVIPAVATTGGAIGGYAVQYFYGPDILAFLHAIHINCEGLHVWQIGAGLSFVASMLKTTVVMEHKE